MMDNLRSNSYGKISVPEMSCQYMTISLGQKLSEDICEVEKVSVIDSIQIYRGYSILFHSILTLKLNLDSFNSNWACGGETDIKSFITSSENDIEFDENYIIPYDIISNMML